MKVTRWEEKLFKVLLFPIKESVDERKIESKLNYYYQRLDTQDLVVAGRIGDVECNYQLLADLGMQALLSIYCAKGKDFDQVFFKKEMKDLGFHRFFSPVKTCAKDPIITAGKNNGRYKIIYD